MTLVVAAAPYVAPWLPRWLKAWTRGKGRRMLRHATYRPSTEHGRHRRITVWDQLDALDPWRN